MPLRVASYNVHQGADATVGAVAHFIAGLGADVVSLHEVPTQAYRDRVAADAGFEHATAIDRGKTLLSRFPIETEEVVDLVSNRGLIRIAVRVDGVPVTIWGVHISWDATGDRQARQIVDEVVPAQSDPRQVFVGDFNDEHFSTQNAILESALVDAWSDLGVRPGDRTTWPATGWAGSEGQQLIDLVMIAPGSGIEVLRGEIPHLAPVLSDHRPIVFDLLLSDPIVVSPPRLRGAPDAVAATVVEVRFDREADVDTAADAALYRIERVGADGAAVETLAVLGAAVDRHRRRVRLETAPHEPNAAYRIVVAGVRARAGDVGMPETTASYAYLPNLLVNPGAEDGEVGWQMADGMTSRDALREVVPYRGGRFFAGGANATASRAVQTVSLVEHADAIDAERASLVVGAWLVSAYLTFPGGESRAEPYDDAEMRVAVLDAAGETLIEVSSGKFDTLYWYPWREVVPLPPGSRGARVTLAGDRKLTLGGPQVDVGLDDVFMRLSIGAEGDVPHAYHTGNLLENGGAEDDDTAPWDVDGAIRRAANYQLLAGHRMVTHSGDGLFLALPRRGGSRMSQTVELPRSRTGEYVRWGGALRSFASRLIAGLRTEVLDANGRVLSAAFTGSRRETQWERFGGFLPLDVDAAFVRVTIIAGQFGTAAVADDLVVQIVGDEWFERGDVDRNARRDIADAVRILLRVLGRGGGVECDDAADVDDDGRLTVADAAALLDHLFRGGPRPPAPLVGAPGRDPTDDALGCRRDR